MTLRYLSGLNGFLPRETGQVVAFVRSPDEFALNEYVQYVKTELPVGVYNKLALDPSVMLPNDDMNAWEDGDEAPRGEVNKHRFQFVEFATFRRAYPWTLGYMAIQNASWRPKQVHMDDAISQCMTARTKRVITLLETASNWGSNTATASTLNNGAGGWDNASDDPNSPTYEAIYKSLMEAFRRAHLATNGKIKMKDMRVVMSPTRAIRLVQSPEVANYVRETPQALQIVKDTIGGAGSEWGLPERYKGFQLVVEDAPIVTEYPAASGTEATTNRTYIKADSSVAMVARPGSLDGEYGTKSYSTVQLYHYDGLLKVEVFDDPENQRVRGRVSENLKEVLAAAVAGFQITGL